MPHSPSTSPQRRRRRICQSDQYQVLLVANKYQTGFDQPLLHTMYVDKRLSGVQAVQTLSRLNRMAPGKEETFVLDFVNDAEEIRRSFQPYYEQTVVAESADPHQLYELQHRLEGMQVFWSSEVEAFCKFFYAPEWKQTAGSGERRAAAALGRRPRRRTRDRPSSSRRSASRLRPAGRVTGFSSRQAAAGAASKCLASLSAGVGPRARKAREPSRRRAHACAPPRPRP
jgi:hypothetical protein